MIGSDDPPTIRFSNERGHGSAKPRHNPFSPVVSSIYGGSKVAEGQIPEQLLGSRRLAALDPVGPFLWL